jgi:SAM-dependent methyltransferase
MDVTPIIPNSEGKWHFGAPWDLFDHFAIAMARNFPGFKPEVPEFQKIYVQLGHGHKFIYGWEHLDLPEWNAEIDAMPFPEASINGIATYHMLDHIRDPRVVLREAQRVLKDGGWFVSIVPHYLGSTAHNCFDHKTEFSIDSWKNAMGNRYDPSQDDNGLEFDIGFNMIMGLSESDLVLVTQLIRKQRAK